MRNVPTLIHTTAMSDTKTQTDPEKYERLIQRISNRSQLQKFIRTIEIAELQLTNDLDSFIESRIHAQENKKLELARLELATSLNNSSNLVDLLSNAGALASRISARVRFLDAERSRVKDTTEYVRQVKELKSLILAANSSLEQRDWDGAAESICKIRTLPLEGYFIDTVVPSTDVPDTPKLTVDKWIDELSIFFTKEFNKAAEAKNVEQLTRFFSLFPKIGKSSIGLDCYSKFICSIISTQSRTIITNNSQQDRIGFYPAALMKLLEIISTMINQHSTIITKYYGVEEMTGIIERVQRESDAQAGLISDTFYDQRNIARIMDEIQTYKFPLLSNYSTSNPRASPPLRRSTEESRNMEDTISVVEIGNVTSEFSALLSYWSMYCRFIAVKWNEYKNSPQEELKLPKPILESRFSKKIQTKFLPSFEVLITFYIRRSLEQALEIEELPDLNPYLSLKNLSGPESPPISSATEDLVMVINTALRQSVETGQPITVKNIVTNIKKVLDNDYIVTLYRRLKDFQPRVGTTLSYVSSQAQLQQQQQQNNKNNKVGSIFMRGANALNQIAGSDETRLHTFLILLNSVNIGSVYLDKVLKQNIDTFSKTFPFGSDSTKLKTIVENLSDGFNKKSEQVLDEFVGILFNQVIKNKLKILLTDCFKDIDYLISTYDEEENIVTRKFIRRWGELINPYQKVLSTKIFDKFIFTIVTTLSNLLERKLWSLSGNINELGSIKLEKDFSGIISDVTRSRYNLRDKFLRVTQIIMILGFDDEDDEIDLNWVLTPSERQRARALRVDRK